MVVIDRIDCTWIIGHAVVQSCVLVCLNFQECCTCFIELQSMTFTPTANATANHMDLILKL